MAPLYLDFGVEWLKPEGEHNPALKGQPPEGHLVHVHIPVVQLPQVELPKILILID